MKPKSKFWQSKRTKTQFFYYCSDFSARRADISVGLGGSQSGYSTVLVRSNVGQKLLEGLDLSKNAAEKEEVIKLSKFKKERARKNFLH